jgi:protocatechuate 3,4-dioxygenase, alpha subunit
VSLPRTPSQTVGPYFTIGMCRRADNVLDQDGVELTGTMLDGRGEPIPDGVVEVWDAPARAWGRCGTDAAGRFSFRIRRGAEALEAYVFARGLLRHERTRILPRALERDDDGRLRFDIRMQGDDATVFYES